LPAVRARRRRGRLGGALRADGTLVGLGTVRPHPRLPHVATIGYSMMPALWGRGLGTELAGLLVEFARVTLGAHEVRATTRDDNPASARVLEKLGFRVLEAGAREADSRGEARRVTRWLRAERGPG
jgi:RimJ/RimL family protein N-acetyltransferase